MKLSRASGVLIHPTSFPGPFGIGDLGPGAMRVLDFLAAAKQRYWQALPLGPTGYGDSPYAALSAFAGNPMLVSPERLYEDDLLIRAEVEDIPAFPPARVDYGEVTTWKGRILRTAHERFEEGRAGGLKPEYERFCAEQRGWLDDYALFAALKADNGQHSWVEWPAHYRDRQPDALHEATERLADEIAYQRFAQFLFERQWAAVRAAARAREIAIIGDIAIFVAHDSADVWANRDLFSLDDAGNPTVVAGVPPDYFSETGQRWGNPLYRWDLLRERDYGWWVARVRRARELQDVIRVDHFRGFAGYWEIPASSETAVEGRWVPGPGADLFAALQRALGDVPVIAEDLGVITPDVTELRRGLGYPGMRILQFAFGGDANNRDLPHNYAHNTVVYTGTHDNDTTAGWFATRDEAERARALDYLHCAPDEIVWAMMRAAESSVALLAVLPLQDVLELGTEARMNFPSRASGNWEWRCTDAQLTDDRAARLAHLAALYGRV